MARGPSAPDVPRTGAETATHKAITSRNGRLAVVRRRRDRVEVIRLNNAADHPHRASPSARNSRRHANRPIGRGSNAGTDRHHRAIAAPACASFMPAPARPPEGASKRVRNAISHHHAASWADSSSRSPAMESISASRAARVDAAGVKPSRNRIASCRCARSATPKLLRRQQRAHATTRRNAFQRAECYAGIQP